MDLKMSKSISVESDVSFFIVDIPIPPHYFARKMDEAYLSETLVPIYQIIRHLIEKYHNIVTAARTSVVTFFCVSILNVLYFFVLVISRR
jgi:hypothetical protein